MSKKESSNFLFLSPLLTIKNGHLTKRDVKNIQISLSHKMGAISLVLAAILFILSTFLFINMGISTGWNQINEYGITSFISQITTMVGTLCVIVFEIISLKSKQQDIKNRFTHIASLLLFIVMATFLFMSYYADAAELYLKDSPTVSASLTLISLLLLIQPVFWIEAIILDGTVTVGLIFLTIYSANKYQIGGVIYYIFIAVVYPIVSYLIVSILFYAETQRYLEELRNEVLHNTAMYDELTLCKNRYALKESLQESTNRWEDDKDSNLLVMLFDIDDFKLYNDQYSHVGGDYCLKTIADCIRKLFPYPNLDFFRYGGEEFLFFIEVNDKSQAEMTMEKIRNGVKRLGIVAAKGAPDQYVTISIGGTFVKASEIKDFSGIIQSVDEYLYQAKASGKNVCVLDGKRIVSQ